MLEASYFNANAEVIEAMTELQQIVKINIQSLLNSNALSVAMLWNYHNAFAKFNKRIGSKLC